MSKPAPGLNERIAAESPQQTDESPWQSADTNFTSDAFAPSDRPFAITQFSRRLPAVLIFVFWTFQFVALSLERLAQATEPQEWSTLQARAVGALFGALFSFVILAILKRTSGTALLKRVLLAIALAVVGALLHGLVNIAAFALLVGISTGPFGDPSIMSVLRIFPLLIYVFLWVYVAISLMLLSVIYGQELISREHQIAELSWEADRARLLALRYQLNPHFLFNALNSAASLVSSQRNQEAELMLVNLGDFLRSTLRLGPAKEIPLAEELHLQSLYLQVEEVRFPRRLRVSTNIPENAMDVLVPSLITQPLIENTIKHSVAKSSEAVHLEIVARAVGDRLSLEIRDDGGNAQAREASGTSVGLQNVAKRLRLHFGEEAHFEAGPAKAGGFVTRMSFPIRRNS